MKKIGLCLTILLTTLAVILAGCTNPSNQPVTNRSNTNAPFTTNSNTSSNSTATANSAATVTMFTLPMLQAFLSNEAFAADLKTRLQLTDSQISQLRTVASEAKKQAQGTVNTAESHSASDARNDATERVKAVIGEEKTQQLAVLVNEYWSNGAPVATPSANATSSTSSRDAVPTDTRIIVNAPAYRMDLFENGQLVKSYKIGIGYPEFPLPVGMRQAKEIIFNPTWTPPDEPWVEGSNKVKVGEKVEAGSKLNPLGIAKIPIGMPSLIHGGKSLNKIGSFASHGCVGLTDTQLRDFVMDLAKLGGAELTSQDIVEYGKKRTETKKVKLNATVPIELRYETIVVEDGKLHIYRDIYDMDSNNEENLRQVLAKYGVTLEQLSQAEGAQVKKALTEMSRDAKGNLDNAAMTKSSQSNANTSSSNPSTPSSLKKDSKADTESGKVTRTFKGAKEMVIEIAALQGKGYPAPVALNTGGAKQATTAAMPKRKG